MQGEKPDYKFPAEAGFIYNEVPAIPPVLTGKIKKYALYFAECSLSVQQSALKVCIAECSLSVQQSALKACNPNLKILFQRINSIISTVSYVYVHLLHLKSIQNNLQTAHARVFSHYTSLTFSKNVSKSPAVITSFLCNYPFHSTAK